MASTSETGHAKNVANFENLISSITAFGTSYNPSKQSIKLTALQTLLANAANEMDAVNAAQSAYSRAVDAREMAFKPLNQLITRVGNALKASDSTPQTNESVQTIIRRLRGKRAGAKLTDEQLQTLHAQGKEVMQVSVSQMSYDNRLDNFDKLIAQLTTIPEYNPNEEDLKIDTLKTLYADLKAKNTDVIAAGVALDNARISRNEIMYKPSSGLVEVASDAKTYVKSVFGASSPQYRQISKLSFKQRTI